jgi:hypothetical protein
MMLMISELSLLHIPAWKYAPALLAAAIFFLATIAEEDLVSVESQRKPSEQIAHGWPEILRQWTGISAASTVFHYWCFQPLEPYILHALTFAVSPKCTISSGSTTCTSQVLSLFSVIELCRPYYFTLLVFVHRSLPPSLPDLKHRRANDELLKRHYNRCDCALCSNSSCLSFSHNILHLFSAWSNTLGYSNIALKFFYYFLHSSLHGFFENVQQFTVHASSTTDISRQWGRKSRAITLAAHTESAHSPIGVHDVWCCTSPGACHF